MSNSIRAPTSAPRMSLRQGPSCTMVFVGLLLLALVQRSDAFLKASQLTQQGGSPAFVATSSTSTTRLTSQLSSESAALSTRGGASVAASMKDIDDEYDEEEEEDEVDIKLARSTIKSARKAKQAVKQEAKAAVNAELSTQPKSRKNKSLFKFIPYIIRACLNPFTVMKMTRGYFKSLFNLDYGRKTEVSQTLRTALEEKAKNFGKPPKRGKRKMRPGQAKTISDLPQLNT